MSKRAGAVSAETRERILSAAREEFWEYGFQGSSLRRICAAAGVTTGALYFFFAGKDDLFENVLSQVTEPFEQLVRDHYRKEQSSDDRDTPQGADADFEVTRMIIQLYFRNRKTWDILVRHVNHPAVQTFLDRFLASSTDHYMALLTTGGAAVDWFAVHQFVHMQVDTMLTLISHGFPQEEMLEHSRTVIRMLRGAFRALLTD